MINLGVPGMNSSQVLHRFRENLFEYKPDIVIMMIGINDPWNLEENDILNNYNGASFSDKVLSGFQLLLNKLRVYQFFKLIYVSTEFKNTGKMSLRQQELSLPDFDNKALRKGFGYSVRNPAKAAALYNSISNNIIGMKQIADEQNVIILFMTYHKAGWGRPEKIIHNTYINLNVSVVDQWSIFMQAQKLGLNVRGRDNWHPNDLGYRLMARNIFNTMIDLRIADSEPIEIFD